MIKKILQILEKNYPGIQAKVLYEIPDGKNYKIIFKNKEVELWISKESEENPSDEELKVAIIELKKRFD